MSGDTSEWHAAACQGKSAFQSPAEANGVVRRMRKKGGDRAKLRAYRCAHCGKYHIGDRSNSR